MYDTVLSPTERLIYEKQCKHMRHGYDADASNNADTSQASSVSSATTSAIVPFTVPPPQLAPPTSVALWFQQPNLEPQQCAEPTRRVAAKLTSPHPLSVASFDAALPNATKQHILDLSNAFKKHTGDVPGPHAGFPKNVRYITCCCELCSKRAPRPHAYLVGLGLVKAFTHIMKVMGGHSRVNDTDTIIVIKAKTGATEISRFYAWLCTGSGAGGATVPMSTDFIQLEVCGGCPPRPPTSLTYGTQCYHASLCKHPPGLESAYPAFMTRTDVDMAAVVISNLTTTDSYVEIAQLDATFIDVDIVDIRGETAGTHTTHQHISPPTCFITNRFITLRVNQFKVT